MSALVRLMREETRQDAAAVKRLRLPRREDLLPRDQAHQPPRASRAGGAESEALKRMTIRQTTEPATGSFYNVANVAERIRAHRRAHNLAQQSDLTLAVQLAERLDRRWFHTRLRRGLPDAVREDVKLLRTMRGVRLLLFWRRPR